MESAARVLAAFIVSRLISKYKIRLTIVLRLLPCKSKQSFTTDQIFQMQSAGPFIVTRRKSSVLTGVRDPV